MGEADRFGKKMGGFMQHGQPMQFEVDIKNTTEITCTCGSKYFTGAVMLRKVSAIVSPTGQEMIAQQPVIICVKCHEPYVSDEMRKFIDMEPEKKQS
jgi:hypothetical protein